MMLMTMTLLITIHYPLSLSIGTRWDWNPEGSVLQMRLSGVSEALSEFLFPDQGSEQLQPQRLNWVVPSWQLLVDLIHVVIWLWVKGHPQTSQQLLGCAQLAMTFGWLVLTQSNIYQSLALWYGPWAPSNHERPNTCRAPRVAASSWHIIIYYLLLLVVLPNGWQRPSSPYGSAGCPDVRRRSLERTFEARSSVITPLDEGRSGRGEYPLPCWY